MTSRFERIASAITRQILARQIEAEEELFVVIDEAGEHEVSKGAFHSMVSSARVRVAAVEEGDEGKPEPFPIWDEEDKERDHTFRSYGHKWQIYVSPKVNAADDKQAGSGLKGLFQTIKNTVSTWMNKIHHEDIIDKVIFGHDLYAYTIEKGRGRYKYTDKETGETKISKEPSYIITLYCYEPRSVAFEIADELRRAFDQKEVIVDVGRGGQPVRG